MDLGVQEVASHRVGCGTLCLSGTLFPCVIRSSQVQEEVPIGSRDGPTSYMWHGTLSCVALYPIWSKVISKFKK